MLNGAIHLLQNLALNLTTRDQFDRLLMLIAVPRDIDMILELLNRVLCFQQGFLLLKK